MEQLIHKYSSGKKVLDCVRNILEHLTGRIDTRVFDEKLSKIETIGKKLSGNRTKSDTGGDIASSVVGNILGNVAYSFLEKAAIVSGKSADSKPDKSTDSKPADSKPIIEKYILTLDYNDALTDLVSECNDIRQATIEASDTFREELAKLLTKLNGVYGVYLKEYHLLDLAAIEVISDLIISPTLDTSIIRRYFSSDRRTVLLYSTIMQKMLDLLSTTDKKAMFKLIGDINEDKDLYMSGIVNTQHKTLPKDNPPLLSFSLVPATNCMKLTDLLTMILPKPTTSTSFQAISKTADAGIIVINKIIYTPIEYNLRPLIISSEIKKYYQPDEYGITSRLVDRFKTIVGYDSSKKWDISIEVYGESNDKFYILETLDGHLYRCMTPWMSNSASYLVGKYKVSPILEYKYGKETRAANYHAACAKVSTRHMFLSKAMSLEGFDTQAKDVESNTIRNDIADKLLEHVQSVIKSKYKNKISSNVDIYEVLHDQDLLDIFGECVVLSYKTGAANEDIAAFEAGKFPFSEVLSTFIVELQKTIRRFAKELHDSYTRRPLPADIFELPSDQRAEEINKKIESVIRDTLVLVIKPTDNIYSTLYFKYLVLNFT